MKSSPKQFFSIIGFLMLMTLIITCKKDKRIRDCFPDATTVRQIVNKEAVIKVTATKDPVWIVEQGSIDTRLIPCNIPMEFYQDGLQVTISGEVKSTVQNSSGPCCIENFVITKITRR